MSVVELAAYDAAGHPLTGLAPAWVSYRDLATGRDRLATAPAITPSGSKYKFTEDRSFQYAGVVDLNAGGGSPAEERYLLVVGDGPLQAFAAFASAGGAPDPLATPAWSELRDADTGASLLSAAPAIEAVGDGIFRFKPLVNVHASGSVDVGAGHSPRFEDVDVQGRGATGASIKRAVAEALADALRLAAPGVTVVVMQAERDMPTQYPAIAVLPRKFTPVLSQDVERASVDDATLLVECGAEDGTIELRACAEYPPQREAVEALVRDAFFQAEQRPGAAYLTVEGVQAMGVQTAYDAPVAVRWGQADWTEELAFSQKRFSFVEVQARLPIFAIRRAPTANTVQAGSAVNVGLDPITEDDSPLTDSPPADYDYIAIDEDGAITPA